MQYYLPTNANIHIFGRTVLRNPLPLFWTASGLEIRTNSSELWFDVESDFESREEWTRIEVDGVLMQRMLLLKGRTKICAFRGWPMDTVRTVRFLKEVQPVREDEKKYLLIHGVECDGELLEVPKKRMNIEFIGDSLSSGEGLGGSAKLVGAGSAMFGTDGHYALKIANHFDADFRILSQGGWGVYCSCHNDLIHIMPKYYEQICGVLLGERNEQLGALEKHDFTQWQPDVVIINLGSNDGFALDRVAWVNSEDGKVYRQETNSYGGVEEKSALRFETAVVDFLKKLRVLNPKAYLLWAYGMCDHTMLPYLKKAVEKYKEESKDTKVDFQSLPTTTELWVGSSNHPGVITHGYAADVLINKIEKKLQNESLDVLGV